MQRGSSRAVWATCSRISTNRHIEELDDSEIERLYARYEARLRSGDDADTGHWDLQRSSFMPDGIYVPPDLG